MNRVNVLQQSAQLGKLVQNDNKGTRKASRSIEFTPIKMFLRMLQVFSGVISNIY